MQVRYAFRDPKPQWGEPLLVLTFDGILRVCGETLEVLRRFLVVDRRLGAERTA